MHTNPHFTPSASYIAQEKKAVADLLALGVTLGEPVVLAAEKRKFGHTMCDYHLVLTADGDDVDGGAASTVLSLLTNGTYGTKPPTAYTLVPCH